MTTIEVPNYVEDIREMMLDDAVAGLLRLYEELPVPRVERAIRSVEQAKSVYMDEERRREYRAKIDRAIDAHNAARESKVVQDFLKREANEDQSNQA